MEGGSALRLDIARDEVARLFALDGAIGVHDGDGTTVAAAVGADHTVLAPPDGAPPTLELLADGAARVLHVVTGEGFGLRRG
jgi:hypothetical protein